MPNLPEQPTAAANGTVDGHAHRWRIAAQAGATSAGVCECGAEKEFPNSWDRETSGRTWTSPGRSSR